MLPSPRLDLSGTTGFRPLGLSVGSWQTSRGYSNPYITILSVECRLPAEERRDCGWGGMSPEQCDPVNCCWEEKPNAPHCYWKKGNFVYELGDIQQKEAWYIVVYSTTGRCSMSFADCISMRIICFSLEWNSIKHSRFLVDCILGLYLWLSGKLQ